MSHEKQTHILSKTNTCCISLSLLAFSCNPGTSCNVGGGWHTFTHMSDVSTWLLRSRAWRDVSIITFLTLFKGLVGITEGGSCESPINDSFLWVDADIAQRQSTILMLDHRVLPIGDRQTMSLTIRKLDRWGSCEGHLTYKQYIIM